MRNHLFKGFWECDNQPNLITITVNGKKVKGLWVEGFYIHVPHGRYGLDEHLLQTIQKDGSIGQLYTVIPETVCECSDLKDRNGKEIFEGDIVKCTDKNNGTEFMAAIEFGNPNCFNSWGWQLHHIKGDKSNLDILLWIEAEETGATIEVVGNVFDNPELLEG